MIDVFLAVDLNQAFLHLQIINIVTTTSAAEDQTPFTVGALKEAGGLSFPQFFRKIFLLKLFIVIGFFGFLIFLRLISSDCIKPSCIVL